jgi:hypothetical protein
VLMLMDNGGLLSASDYRQRPTRITTADLLSTTIFFAISMR